jgi:hypothetical protein
MHAPSDAAKRIMRTWAASLDADVVLRYATTGHAADPAFMAFIDQLAGLSPRITPKKDPDAQVERPTLFAGARVAYQALPDERELEPFLGCLTGSQGFVDGIDRTIREALGRLQMPAPVTVFITPGCPYCPSVVASLLGLAALNENVRLTVIDGALFADAVGAHRITAAPTVILDDQLRWTGPLNMAEVVAMMLDRDPVNLSAGALKGMLENGAADAVARMMADRQRIFPAFIELLLHPRWSVRLGAMVAFESVVETAPALAGEVTRPLMAAYPDLDDTIKGDLLYVLGVSGRREVLPFLNTIAETVADAELRSAAEEAIASLTQLPHGE